MFLLRWNIFFKVFKPDVEVENKTVAHVEKTLVSNCMKEAGVHLRLQPGNHFGHKSNFFALLWMCNQEVHIVASWFPSVETVHPSSSSQNRSYMCFTLVCVADGCFGGISLLGQPRLAILKQMRSRRFSLRHAQSVSMYVLVFTSWILRWEWPGLQVEPTRRLSQRPCWWHQPRTWWPAGWGPGSAPALEEDRAQFREQNGTWLQAAAENRRGRIKHLLVVLGWVFVLIPAAAEDRLSPVWSTARLFCYRLQKYRLKPNANRQIIKQIHLCPHLKSQNYCLSVLMLWFYDFASCCFSCVLYSGSCYLPGCDGN